LYNAIINHPDVKSGKVSLESMVVTLSGASPMSYSLKQEFEALGGRALVQGYGMSELSGATHANPVLGENRRGSIGLPLPDVDCAVIDLKDEVSEVPVGEVGEIVIQAPHTMKEYLNRPEETDSLLRRREDGRLWAYSGDVGYMDEDGYFYLVGRKKNMVLIGGFNVYPIQIEDVLRSHPAITNARVFGEAHPKSLGEEALVAYVVLKPGHTVKARDLIGFCKEHLAGYEVPRRYEFVDELPGRSPDEPEHYQRIPMLKQEEALLSV
jgi:long-chain acyl-CoA synthetase